MIEVDNLYKTYQHKSTIVPVLDNINFTVKRGEIFGIIGKSGAGKSTLLKCLNLLEKPSSGRVIIDGVDLTTLSYPELRSERQKIGVIFQGFNLLSAKTVFANVALPLVLQGKHSKELIATKVNQLLNLVGLSEFADKYPVQLSGGQKQRVGIARALATEPKVLLSDEATSALDTETTNSILELLLDINQKMGLTIVLITHEIAVVRKICDRVAVIDNGKIIEIGNTIDVVLHPKEQLTRKLILEEDTHKYLEQVNDFYKFNKDSSGDLNTNNGSDLNAHFNAHLLVMSFIGNQTFDPVLSRVSQQTGVNFSILRGELGHIKKMPFGQLLLEVSGDTPNLNSALLLLDTLNVNYEIIQ